MQPAQVPGRSADLNCIFPLPCQLRASHRSWHPVTWPVCSAELQTCRVSSEDHPPGSWPFFPYPYRHREDKGYRDHTLYPEIPRPRLCRPLRFPGAGGEA